MSESVGTVTVAGSTIHIVGRVNYRDVQALIEASDLSPEIVTISANDLPTADDLVRLRMSAPESVIIVERDAFFSDRRAFPEPVFLGVVADPSFNAHPWFDANKKARKALVDDWMNAYVRESMVELGKMAAIEIAEIDPDVTHIPIKGPQRHRAQWKRETIGRRR